MELKNFISETLKQVCQGIEVAKRSYGEVIAKATRLNHQSEYIHFEVYINVEQKGSNSTVAGRLKSFIKVSNSNKDINAPLNSNNRITFKVPFVPQYIGQDMAQLQETLNNLKKSR